MPRVSHEYEQTQKKRIIEGSAKVFAEYGYRQTTMDKICQTLKISKGAVYIYFKNKEELFVSTMDFIFQRRYDLLSSAFEQTDPLPVKFEKIFNCLGNLVSSDDNYTYTRLSVEGFLESDRIPNLQLVKADSYNRFYKLLYDLLTQGQATEQINTKLDISSMIVVMMATLDGFMMHSLVQGRELDPERIQKVVLEIFSQALNFSLQIQREYVNKDVR
ncbi:MAG: TetR/AcrR family transcriptional regulator [Anaerocolumna sp.]